MSVKNFRPLKPTKIHNVEKKINSFLQTFAWQEVFEEQSQLLN